MCYITSANTHIQRERKIEDDMCEIKKKLKVRKNRSSAIRVCQMNLQFISVSCVRAKKKAAKAHK